MSRSRRRRVLCLSVLATALAVSACGGGPTGSPAAGPTSEPTAVPSAAPAPTVTVDTADVATDPPAGGDGASPSSSPSSSGPDGSSPAGPASSSGAAPGRPQPVVVTTTYAGVLSGGSSVEAGGFVDVVESDGTCTLTLTRGPATHEAGAAATPDRTGTSCGGLEVPLSDLAPGTWEVVLSYESSTSAGRAAAVDVVVQ